MRRKEHDASRGSPGSFAKQRTLGSRMTIETLVTLETVRSEPNAINASQRTRRFARLAQILRQAENAWLQDNNFISEDSGESQ
jgi:hypothetical protein